MRDTHGADDEGCSLLKNALKYERFLIGKTIDTSMDAGDDNDDMEVEVSLSSQPSYRAKTDTWRM